MVKFIASCYSCVGPYVKFGKRHNSVAELSPRVYKALGLISSNQLRKKNRNSLFTDSSLVFIIHTCNEKINADFFCCSLLTYLLTCIIHISWRHFKWCFAMSQGINKPLNSLLCPEAFHTAKVCLACRRAHALPQLSHHTLSAVVWDSTDPHAACHWAYTANGKRKGREQVEPKGQVGDQQMSW